PDWSLSEAEVLTPDWSLSEAEVLTPDWSLSEAEVLTPDYKFSGKVRISTPSSVTAMVCSN
ncbi:hypothetical protein, partial [Dolichospermum circinale]|uniref:hypothetical protein n=1 Tax=Dolichospermum circinale TaxID=109265 RepID=UPI00232C2AAF